MSQRVTQAPRKAPPTVDLPAVLAAIVCADEMWPEGVSQVPEVLGEIDDGKVDGVCLPLPSGEAVLVLGAPGYDRYDLFRVGVDGAELDPRMRSPVAAMQGVPFDELSFSLVAMVRPTANQDIDLGQNAHLHPERVEEAALSGDEWAQRYFLGCLAELAERGDKRSQFLVEMAGDELLLREHIDMADVTFPRLEPPAPPPKRKPVKPPRPVKGKRSKRRRQKRR